jgi:hypothetical protein
MSSEVHRRPSLSGVLYHLAAPAPFFFVANAFPLILWLCIDSRWFGIALQGFSKAPFTPAAALFWSLLFISFWAGTRLASIGKRLLVLAQPRLQLMRRIHAVSLAFAIASAIAIAHFFIKGGPDALFLLSESNANELKIALYSADTTYQLAIMARHLVLTALITWPFVTQPLSRRVSLGVLSVTVVFLTLFTSSRLTAISAVLIWLLALRVDSIEEKASSIYVRRLLLGVLFILTLFGIGVFTRSVGTWAGLTGSDNILLNASAEFLAYYISPVNYSTAIVNDFDAGGVGLAAVYVFGFIFSVLNVDDPTAVAAVFDSIAPYYNSSLNQIGLLGQFFTGFGPLFVVPVGIYGYVAQRAYLSYRRRSPWGVLFYPLVYISLFDSFRGFLLTQNILAANWIFSALMVGVLSFMGRYLRGRAPRSA